MAFGDLSQVLSYKQTHLKEWSTFARAWVRWAERHMVQSSEIDRGSAYLRAPNP